jgi:hypothetical protein
MAPSHAEVRHQVSGERSPATRARVRYEKRAAKFRSPFDVLASPRGFVGDISAFASKIEIPLDAWQRAA